MENQLANTQQNNLLQQLAQAGLLKEVPPPKEIHRGFRREERVIQRPNEIINEVVNTIVEVYYF